jgi:hypothetical protein
MRRRIFRALLAAGAFLMIAAPIVAHHGAASFGDKEITLKGTVTEWVWANPHCFLKFDAKDDTGTVRAWVVETSNPTDMTTRGWRRTSFKVRDEITVTLLPYKNGAPVGRARKVVFANGQTLAATGAAAETSPAIAAPQPER